MPPRSSQARSHPPINYRDSQGRIWQASEVAQLRVLRSNYGGQIDYIALVDTRMPLVDSRPSES